VLLWEAGLASKAWPNSWGKKVANCKEFRHMRATFKKRIGDIVQIRFLSSGWLMESMFQIPLVKTVELQEEPTRMAKSSHG
jgi:hypothetical protein